MPHVDVSPGLPGIISVMERYPDTARPLNELAQALLRGGEGMSPGERELIATYVSSLNACAFCAGSHAATARRLLDDPGAVDAVMRDRESAPVSPRMKALLRIAAKVQRGGRGVTDEEVAAARAEGAGDREIHDTVLIAAAFCMYNRYVDGLATRIPDDPAEYEPIGEQLATRGYPRGEPALAAA
jgi:uncharacterized peroxidase-related enzyme